jgi:hypothetical protein
MMEVRADEDGVTVFITDPTDLDLVSKALPEHGFTVLSNKLGTNPKTLVTLPTLAPSSLRTWKISWLPLTATTMCKMYLLACRFNRCPACN